MAEHFFNGGQLFAFRVDDEVTLAFNSFSPSSLLRRGATSRTRCCISRAALLVNVIAKIFSGEMPREIMCAMRKVITRVLPVPAPARIKTGPLVLSTACLCSGFRALKFTMRARSLGTKKLRAREERRGARNFVLVQA
jgi:hypothetical protein